MDRLRQQLQRMSEQLNGLSASQKMLTASLVAIMVMTLLWWGRYAASPELVPVLDRSISAQDMLPIQAVLQARGIDARIVNDRIMVPVERRMEAIAAMGMGGKLPLDSADAWDEIIKKSSPWDTSQKTSVLFNKAKQELLSQLIRRYFPDVNSASVVIEPTMQRQIGGSGNVLPSASVFIEAKPNAKFKELANGAAATVASAQAGLTIGRVTVVINGRNYRPHDSSDEEGLADATLMELRHVEEERYVRKIRDQVVQHVPMALVTVSVDVDNSSTQETSKSYDQDKTFNKETMLDTETTETVSQNPAPVDEAGAQANTGLSTESDAPQLAANTTTSEKQKVQMQVFPSETVKHTTTRGGRAKVISAAVRLPESFFVQLYRRGNANASTDPDAAALKPLIDKEMTELRPQIAAACGLTSDEAVWVGTYPDASPPMAAAITETVASGTGSPAFGGLLGVNVKEIAIGALAVVSLVMMMLMVRRGPAVPAIAPPVELREVVPLAAELDVAGEASEGAAMLDGMELDEDTIKAQQMVQQVATMVSENPDGAANLVKRWLNRN